MSLVRDYPMSSYPYARDENEERYYQLVHYLSSALLVYGAGDKALAALRSVWNDVMAAGLEPAATADTHVRRNGPHGRA